MLKQRLICVLGLWVALLPFFGLPFSWKKVLFALTGLFIFGLGYLLYRERRAYLNSRKNNSKVFMEKKPEHQFTQTEVVE